jgi:hypothetical protein
MLPPGDAADIDDEDDLWRRIPRKPSHLVNDHGRWRPSSAAFADHPDDGGMSVLVGREDAPERATSGKWEGYLLAALPAGSYRRERQRVPRDPTVEDPNHAQVIGEKPRNRRLKWAESARWVINPE